MSNEFDMGEYWLDLDDDPAAADSDDTGDEFDDAEIEAAWARDEAASE